MSENRIRILPPHLVNRIAAGEVVERPASVIKELVENALDAGATKIEIHVGGGGRNIRVADNGNGMTPADARLAFYNHATSKLTDENSLYRIETLGFRGEALASIAAISRTVCLTRTTDAQLGTKVIFEHSGEPKLSEAGCAPGTVMEVSDLFYNTPARLKFMKRPQTEMGHLEEMVQTLALSHPGVQISLTLNDKPALRTGGSGDLKTTIDEVYRFGGDINKLIAVSWQDAEAGLKLTGFISSPDIQKPQKRWITTMVNQRNIRCSIFSKAVELAYKSLMPEGRYPVAVLFFSLPPDDLDVNVHPTKKEVRYAHPNEVFSFIKCGLQQALESNGFRVYAGPVSSSVLPDEAPVAGLSEPFPFYTSLPTSYGNLPLPPARYAGPFHMAIPAFNPASGTAQQALSFYKPFQQESRALAGQADYESLSPGLSGHQPLQEPVKVIGQLFNTYLLLETAQGLLVVDQHIASERAFFEALSKEMPSPEEARQHLIIDLPLQVSPVERELLLENQRRFTQLGFLYDFISGSEIILKSLPLIYQDRIHPHKLFQSLIAGLEENGEAVLDLDHLIATLACHSAVRAGDILTHHDMEIVIQRWLACRLPWTCPHGRPIAHTIKTEELNLFFERKSLPVNAF